MKHISRGVRPRARNRHCNIKFDEVIHTQGCSQHWIAIDSILSFRQVGELIKVANDYISTDPPLA